MDSNDLEANALFTTDGTDVWRLKTYCLQPTCQLHNAETGAIEGFGMGGLTARRFHKIKMPVEEIGGPIV